MISPGQPGGARQERRALNLDERAMQSIVAD
jgi:hypothetical protein